MKTRLKQRLTEVLDRIFYPQHEMREAPQPGYKKQRQIARDTLERVIDGTDPRIRLVSGYQRRLTQAISSSIDYIEQVIECIPSVIQVNSGNFVNDASVNAFFASPRELQQTLRHSSELVDYFQQYENHQAQSCWALLCMRKSERQILGMDLAAGQVRHDVRQVAVSFHHHHIQSPAANEQEAREGLKQCLFEGLITSALAELSELRARRRNLMTRLRIVRGRLREYPSDSKDRNDAETELSRLTEELKTTGLPTPAACLQRVTSTFLHPERFVRMQRLSLKLDKMGIRIDDDFSGSCNQLDLAEARIGDQPPRIVVLARLEAEDFREFQLIPARGSLPELHVN